MIPVMLSNIIASYSFVGEKEKKTIEALLYTPINTNELIMGKLLAAAIPSLVITWGFSFLYSCIVNFFSLKLFDIAIFPNLEWVLLILFMVPVVNILSVILVILASQRLKSSKSAQSVSMIIVFPIMGLVISQVFGVMLLKIKLILVVFVLLSILNFILFRIASNKFNAEKYILNI